MPTPFGGGQNDRIDLKPAAFEVEGGGETAQALHSAPGRAVAFAAGLDEIDQACAFVDIDARIAVGEWRIHFGFLSCTGAIARIRGQEVSGTLLRQIQRPLAFGRSARYC